jgi:hypothetical protein
VDFDSVIRWKERVLRQSWDHFAAHAGKQAREELETFRSAAAQAGWLSDWTLFSALRARFSGRPWLEWDRDVRERDAGALERASGELEAEISYQAYLQYLFFRQWERVRIAARDRGVKVMGDAPMYVSLDSADVWAPDLQARRKKTLFPASPDRHSNRLALGQSSTAGTGSGDRLRLVGPPASRTCASAISGVDPRRAAYWSVLAGESCLERPVAAAGSKLFDAPRSSRWRASIVAEDLDDREEVKALLARSICPA